MLCGVLRAHRPGRRTAPPRQSARPAFGRGCHYSLLSLLSLIKNQVRRSLLSPLHSYSRVRHRDLHIVVDTSISVHRVILHIPAPTHKVVNLTRARINYAPAHVISLNSRVILCISYLQFKIASVHSMTRVYMLTTLRSCLGPGIFPLSTYEHTLRAQCSAKLHTSNSELLRVCK